MNHPSLPTVAAPRRPARSQALLRPTVLALIISVGALVSPCLARPPSDVATGPNALKNVTNAGVDNTADGYFALNQDTTGSGNTAVGSHALEQNTTASGNTATGVLGLFNNTTGAGNTASGALALVSNTVGNENVANGSSALFKNTTGNDNTSNGANSSHETTTGIFNTVNGASALYSNTTGGFNTADGAFALNLSRGSNNIALGYSAGINLTSGDGNIYIGNQGTDTESGSIRIGTEGNHVATFVAGINSAVVAGTTVLIDANGQLGTVLSSRRFKEEIKPMDKASEIIFGLKPVAFRYNNQLDPDGIPQFGLIAEEVEKVNPTLVTRDAEGKVHAVRYEALNVMLLNEFLKEHRKVAQMERTFIQQQKDLQAVLKEQQNEIRALTAKLKEQASQIQQVKTELRLGKPAPHIVANDQ